MEERQVEGSKSHIDKRTKPIAAQQPERSAQQRQRITQQHQHKNTPGRFESLDYHIIKKNTQTAAVCAYLPRRTRQLQRSAVLGLRQQQLHVPGYQLRIGSQRHAATPHRHRQLVPRWSQPIKMHDAPRRPGNTIYVDEALAVAPYPGTIIAPHTIHARRIGDGNADTLRGRHKNTIHRDERSDTEQRERDRSRLH